MPVVSRTSLTAQALDAKFARRQQRYTEQYSFSYVHQPAPPPLLLRPERQQREPSSPFPAWRAAAAELDPHGEGAGHAPSPAARGEAPVPGVAAPSPRTLHGVLLGTTAVALLGVLGGIGYFVWSGAVPGAAALGGTAPKGFGVPPLVQPLVDFAAKTGTAPVPTSPSPPTKEATAGIPTSPVAPLPPLSAAPVLLALAAPPAGQPVLADPPLPAPGPSAMTGQAVPVPEREAAGPGSTIRPPESDAAPPARPLAAATGDGGPAPERAAVAALLPGTSREPGATPPVPAVPGAAAPIAEPVAALAGPLPLPPKPDAAPPSPTIAAAVRLPPAPEWAGATASALAGLPEAAVLPSAPPTLPAVPASPAQSAGPATVPGEAAKEVPPGVDARQVVNTMTLVQQMSLLVHNMHDDGLRFRAEMAALTGAVQAKASSLEERLRLAEARSATGAGAEAGLPLSDAAAGVLPVLRGYRVQAGSPGAAVLTDVGAGSERAARLLVMVGDQLPGAGRVTAIVQRGRGWVVRTERGVIQ